MIGDLSQWRFCVDVGGTFTDCIAFGPRGEVRRLKVLSTGVFKGRTGADPSSSAVSDPAFSIYPDGFFKEYAFRSVDAAGSVRGTARVAEFRSEDGCFFLHPDLPLTPASGSPFELSSGEEAPLVAIRCLAGLSLSDPTGPVDLRLGTTVGTNALLERRGARTAFVTTAGFEDLPLIGTQDRPDLFALDIRLPEPLFETVRGVAERIDGQGTVITPLSEEDVRRTLLEIRASGIPSVAVSLLNAYQNPVHEKLTEAVAREVGFPCVRVSHRVAPAIKIVPRSDTTIVDAYLSPVVEQYLGGLQARLPEARLRTMTSTGGLVPPGSFTGKDSVLSGPAGGVVGFARVACEEGFSKAVGFDMGGTSTDVSRFDGRSEFEYETRKAGVRLSMPMLAIETVAAGGGSICLFDGQRFTVGPDSAGAHPGPACYGRGGPLTLTDVNLFLGLVVERHFPFALDRAAVERALKAVAGDVETRTGRPLSLKAVARGFRRIADANMAAPIRHISVARGYDIREYVLVAFGGAGPQHAASVARELGMETILLHPSGGVLSALGMGSAGVRRHDQRPLARPYSAEGLREADALFNEMVRTLTAEVLAEGVPREKILPPRRLLDMRYSGEGSTLTVDASGHGDFARAFSQAHTRRFGHAFEGRDMEIVNARVEVEGESSLPKPRPLAPSAGECEPTLTAEACLGEEFQTVPVFERGNLCPGHRLQGPALVVEETSTIVIDPGWEGEVTALGNLLLHDREGSGQSRAVSREVDPVMLEIFQNQFASIADRSGEVLRRTAFSTNIKERLDYSCAVFDARGGLVANAPHIPVHLGAMGQTIRALLRDVPGLRPGQVYLTNDPSGGGSHLPDLTVITPVFDESTGSLIFFTACRAHHAEIGGIRPGSMPPDSVNLEEEGVLFRNFLLVENGILQRDSLWDALTSGKYPSRQPGENLFDLEAQIAANRTGVLDLREMVAGYGLDAVTAYMGHIQDAAREKMGAALRRLDSGRYPFEDKLDDGTRLKVTIDIEDGRARVDFTGTADVHPGNFNAGGGVTRAAVLYSFRLLLREDIPLNEGVLDPITIHVPPGLLSPPPGPDPSRCAAVAAGNVETSQRVVDVILGALGSAAASQGTMNNVALGDELVSYYETLCGGAGAGPGFSGASAVHTHMTNTRLTDPEVLEARLPVRLVRFAIRRGSGGAGGFRGGDGVIRELEFLRRLELSIISTRRRTSPYGLKGGLPGRPGRNRLIRSSGSVVDLDPVSMVQVGPGDRLIIETPGGGGYGVAE